VADVTVWRDWLYGDDPHPVVRWSIVQRGSKRRMDQFTRSGTDSAVRSGWSGRRVIASILLVVLGASACSEGEPSTAVTPETSLPDPTSSPVESVPSECIEATAAWIDITERIVSDDPTANTVVGPGLTTFEVALVEVGRTCGRAHIGSGLGEWILWADAKRAQNDDLAESITELLDGMCRDLDKLPPVSDEAASVCRR
jgi:hypothetical protein